MQQLIATGLLLLAMQPGDTPVGSGPEPSPAPISWEFDFKYQMPESITVQLTGESRPAVYWYMLYSVTNTSNATQRFYPTFELVTDELEVIETDVGISPLVFDAIKERHRLTHKYLVHPTRAIGDLRTGADYAIESVAIWRADDLDATRFTIYVAGLSGEASLIENPAYDPSKPEVVEVVSRHGRTREVTVNAKTFTLRKTLELQFVHAASTASRGLLKPRLERSRWIMR